MHLILWELAQQGMDSVEMNKAFAANDIPPIATEDSTTRTFRQAWVKFSSIHDKKYQAHRISDEEIAVIDRDLNQTDRTLDLSHVASIQATLENKGNTQIYYRCHPKACSHTQTLISIQTNVCPKCNREIPDIAYAIIKNFKKNAQLVSNQSRSNLYSKITSTLLNGCSFMSTGRPFMIPDKMFDKATSFKAAVNQIGDKCYTMKIVEGGGDEREIVTYSITSTIEEIDGQLNDLERSNAFENRIEKLTQLMDKVSMYETVLDITKDQLIEKASQLKEKIHAILLT